MLHVLRNLTAPSWILTSKLSERGRLRIQYYLQLYIKPGLSPILVFSGGPSEAGERYLIMLG